MSKPAPGHVFDLKSHVYRTHNSLPRPHNSNENVMATSVEQAQKKSNVACPIGQVSYSRDSHQFAEPDRTRMEEGRAKIEIMIRDMAMRNIEYRKSSVAAYQMQNL